MIVYKYVHPDRVDVLEHGFIRLTQPAALNDPFETYPCFHRFEESLRRRSRKTLNNHRDEMTSEAFVTVSLGLNKRVHDRMLEWQRELSTKNVLLSLTKKRNNLLMWSHYADSHRGFVIGFDSNHYFFNQEKPRVMTPLRDVNYSANRLVVPAFEECSTEEMIESLGNIFYFTKSAHWAYEEESRMIAQAKNAGNIIKVKSGHDIYLYEFPSDLLKEIILGYLMPQEIKRKLSDIVASRHPHVKLYEAILNEAVFDLDIVPYRNPAHKQ